MEVFNTLAPVFVMIALGSLLRKACFFDDMAVVTLNRCCYWIGLPAVLFYKIGLEPAPEGTAIRTVLALLGATGLLLLAALLLGLLMRQPARKLATFMHVSFRGNLAYVGLPVVVYAFEQRPDGNAAGAIAAVGLGVCLVFYNVIAIMLHLTAEHSLNANALKRMLYKTLTNPLLLACLAGFLLQHTPGAAENLPRFVERSLILAGQFAMPLALLCVGSALVTTPLRQVAVAAATAALLKTAGGFILGFGMARLLGLPPMETGVVCILMATPTAIASYVLTEQLHGDDKLAAGTIALSTLFGAISLASVLWLLK